MRRIYMFILFSGLLACQTAEDAEPGNAETFIKLVGSEFQDEPAKLLALTNGNGQDDGVLVLGTAENERLSSFKIRLARLDNNGNTIWERIYPQDSTEFSYKARSMVAVDDGYFIVGDSIKNEIEAEDGEEEEEGISGLLIMKVDLDGVPVDNLMKTEALEDAELRGQDAIINDEGDLVVISGITNLEEPEDGEEQNDILLTIYDITNLMVLCNQQYSGGKISLAPSLATNIMGDYAFSGTISSSGNQNGRFLTIPSTCSSGTISGPILISGSTNNYVVNQMIKTLSGFAVVGTTDASGLKTDIFIGLLDPLGNIVNNGLFIYDSLDGKNLIDEEEGLTLTNTSDGGFIISGSTRTNTGAGETNIVLIKVDIDGNVQWTNQFGDLNEEEGTFIQQTADGGYYILGSTEFGGLDTIILIRTDSEGNVE